MSADNKYLLSDLICWTEKKWSDDRINFIFIFPGIYLNSYLTFGKTGF